MELIKLDKHFSHIIRPRRDIIVYTAGPYTGSNGYTREDNVKLASAQAASIWDLGYTVICPQANSSGFENICQKTKYDGFLQGDFRLIDISDVVLFLERWHTSEGSQKEYTHCKQTNKPYVFCPEQLEIMYSDKLRLTEVRNTPTYHDAKQYELFS